MKKGNNRAIEQFLAALSNKRRSEMQHVQIQKLLAKFLPPWFVPMLNDKKRTGFYRKMIRRNVKGKTVLEIGCGVGTMSIAAAQAGAKHVFACEVNPFLHYIAKTNIQNAGLSEKITLFNCHSKDLSVKRDLKNRVDVVLSELISTDIFSEEVISSLKDSRRLLKRGGLFLPGKIEVNATLIEIQGDLSFEAHDSSVFPELLTDLLKGKPHFVDLSRRKYRALGETKRLFSISGGYKLSEKFPLRIKLKAKSRSQNSFVCLSFSLLDDRLKLAGFSEKKVRKDSHWGGLIWRVTANRSEYGFKIIRHQNRIFAFES